jgi:hypothetical protein
MTESVGLVRHTSSRIPSELICFTPRCRVEQDSPRAAKCRALPCSRDETLTLTASRLDAQSTRNEWTSLFSARLQTCTLLVRCERRRACSGTMADDCRQVGEHTTRYERRLCATRRHDDVDVLGSLDAALLLCVDAVVSVSHVSPRVTQVSTLACSGPCRQKRDRLGRPLGRRNYCVSCSCMILSYHLRNQYSFCAENFGSRTWSRL